MATFKILDTLMITNRGFVLIGDITDNGSISNGDSVLIPHNNSTIRCRINNVEMVDYDSPKLSSIGLFISLAETEDIKDLNLAGLEIQTISEE